MVDNLFIPLFRGLPQAFYYHFITFLCNCRVNIQPEDILPFVSILPKNVTKNVYVTFKVEKEEVDEVDVIELVLVEYTGRIHRLKINFGKLNPELIVWDGRIWSVA